VLFDKLDTGKMRVLDTSNVSCRDESSGIWALLNTLSAVETLPVSVLCKFMIDQY